MLLEEEDVLEEDVLEEGVLEEGVLDEEVLLDDAELLLDGELEEFESELLLEPSFLVEL